MSASQGRGPGGIERRRARRVPPEELAQPIQVVGTRLVNVSLGGLLIEAPVPLAPDSRLRLRLIVEGVKSELEGRVAACRRRPPGTDRGWGVGVEFTTLPADTRERLERALGSWRARPRSA